MLEIRLPDGAAEFGDAELWSALVALWPRYLSYTLSFVVIGTFWVVHHRKFQYIRRSSPTLIWLNLLFLLAIGFMPFVTDVIAENGNSVATVAYAAVVTLVSLIGAAMSLYAAGAGLTDNAASPWRMALPSLTTALVFGLSIPVAAIDADLGKYFWLALIPANIFAGRVARHVQP